MNYQYKIIIIKIFKVSKFMRNFAKKKEKCSNNDGIDNGKYSSNDLHYDEERNLTIDNDGIYYTIYNTLKTACVHITNMYMALHLCFLLKFQIMQHYIFIFFSNYIAI